MPKYCAAISRRYNGPVNRIHGNLYENVYNIFDVSLNIEFGKENNGNYFSIYKSVCIFTLLNIQKLVIPI